MDRGLTLDAGALIAVERGDRVVVETIRRAVRAGRPVDIVPGVLAQVWRGGGRQARLARLLAVPGIAVVGFSPSVAKLVGELIGITGHPDVTDVHVALHARQHSHAVVTSDPEDIRAVDPALHIIGV